VTVRALDQRLHHLALRPEVPMADIRLRLGARQDRPMDEAAAERLLTRTVTRGLSLCQSRGVWRAVAVTAHRSDGVTFADGSELQGGLVARLLHGCVAALAMAATVGPEIVAAIAQDMADGHAAEAVILDAVGSEMADAAVVAIQARQARELPLAGYTLTRRRISPGFADFDLGQQAWFHRNLELTRLGLSLTEACQLVPEKSVTAIVGIRVAAPDLR
jgi:hypothetical protein